MAIFLGGSGRREESSPPQNAKASDIVVPVAPYDPRYPGFYSDTTFAVNPTDEVQVLRDGGVMNLYSFTQLDPAHYAQNNIASLVDFALSPGRKAVRSGTSYGTVVYDGHGVLDNDEWTITVWIRSVGVDLNALPALSGASVNFGAVLASKQTIAFSAEPGSPRHIRCRITLNESGFLVAGSATTLDAEIALSTGDVPADAWVPLTASYDSTYGLSLVLGGDSAPSTYILALEAPGVPISWWSMFSTGSTEEDQEDSNNGTYSGSVTRGIPGAIRGSHDVAARFTAQNGGGYLDCGNPASLKLTAGTISLWVRVNNNTGSYRAGLVTKDKAYTVELVDGIIYTVDYGGGDTPIGSSGDVGDGNWHFVTMVWAAGSNNTKVYVDAALVLTTTTSVTNQLNNLKIGQPLFSYSSTDRQIDITEVAIHAEQLTSTDIAYLYSWHKPKFVTVGAFGATLRPWGARSDQLAGVTTLGGPNGMVAYQGVDATVPEVHRYSRYKQRQLYEADGTRFSFRAGPTVSVDVGTVTGDWTPEIAGVVDRNSATNSATDATALAQWQLLEDAGCPLVRTAENDLLAPITSTSPLTIDWTDFDAYHTVVKNAGNPAVHAMCGYVPAAIRSGGARNGPPTSNSTFAAWQSAVLGRMITTLGLNVVSISFWNEPGLQWTGNLAQFKALWLATAQQVASDHPSFPKIGGPDSESEAASGSQSPNYLKGVVDQAVTSGITLPEVYVHSYTPHLTTALENLDSVASYVAGKFTPACKTQMTEWGHREVIFPPGSGANLFGAGAPGYSWESHIEHQSRNVFEAAFAYAMMYEAMERGTTKAAYYTMAQNSPSFPGLMSGILDGTTGLPRPFPIFHAFELVWKHSGDRVAATSSWPGLRAICTEDNGTVTLTYGNLKRSKGLHPDKTRFAIEWDNLPASFTWKQWQVDEDTPDLARLLPIATGNQDNLPLSVTIDNLGVGCIQIT